MISNIEKAFKKLQINLEATLQYMDGLSEEQLYKAPPEAWSSVQILHHLYQSEIGITAYINKKLQAPVSEIEKTGLSGWIRSLLLNRALNDQKKKYRVPSSLAAVPDRPSYVETKDEYLNLRVNLSELLEKFDSNMAARGYFKHPRAGRINILQTLSFMSVHIERHLEQIRERSA